MASYNGVMRLPPIGELGLPPIGKLPPEARPREESADRIVDKNTEMVGRSSRGKEGTPISLQDSGIHWRRLSDDESPSKMEFDRKRDLMDSGLVSLGEQTKSYDHGMKLNELSTPLSEALTDMPQNKKSSKGSKRREPRKHPRKKNESGLICKENHSEDERNSIIVGHLLMPENGQKLASETALDGVADVNQGSKHESFVVSHHNASTLTENTLISDNELLKTSNANSIFAASVASSEGQDRTDYRELAIRLANNYSRPKSDARKRRTFVDYVLVFDKDDENEFNEKQRESFEKLLVEEGIEVSRSYVENHIYVELCCSFGRLCQEAEAIFLEMPLIGLSLHHNEKKSTSRWKSFQSEREVDDICIPFCNATKEIYDGFCDRENFFRPGIRSLLVDQILKTIKIDEADSMEQHNVEALAYLIHSDVYVDAFILHERSCLDPSFPLMPYRRESADHYPMESKVKPAVDRRKDLHATWLSNFKFQPLWKIRNYFGEKIALYFAWLGMLITSLWIPTFIGLFIFIYGIILALAKNEASTWSRVAFDNDLTPGFALIICLWGTVFLELWKRKNAELAYKWDVDDFEQQEPNRPQFYGTEMQLNPITGLYEPFYSPLRKTLKSMGSMTLILFMVLLVVGSMISVIVYRIIARVDWFSGKNSTLLSNITSSVLNSTSIMLLGYIYKYLGKKLTEWENHRTQTQFEDSLILKLFGFQFVNSYSSLYYIAFFRERTKDGILGKGDKYTDSCGTSNDCMSLLSLQVGILMLMKPMPKFATDVAVPLLLKALRSVVKKMKRNKVLVEGSFVNEHLPSDVEFDDYIQNERRKPGIKDFTLSEYTEKVIQYGYLMLFAAACPLAPLIALLTNLVDLRIDARRLLWLNRRPIPLRAQDIGMWYTILQLLNYIGVITNGFIIAITSSFGRKYKTTTIFNVIVSNTTSYNNTGSLVTATKAVNTLEYLWIIILFQNISFVVKFILEYSISDEPEKITLARKKEKYVIEAVLKTAGYRRGRGKSIVPAVAKANRCPTEEDQILIEKKTKERKETTKERIRKMSNKQTKGKRKEISRRPAEGRTNKFYINENKAEAGRFGESLA